MLEISAVGIGMMMTGVAVAVGGLMLEATLLVLCRVLRPRAIGVLFEPEAIDLS